MGFELSDNAKLLAAKTVKNPQIVLRIHIGSSGAYSAAVANAQIYGTFTKLIV